VVSHVHPIPGVALTTRERTPDLVHADTNDVDETEGTRTRQASGVLRRTNAET
jgi:hypothetical protein